MEGGDARLHQAALPAAQTFRPTGHRGRRLPPALHSPDAGVQSGFLSHPRFLGLECRHACSSSSAWTAIFPLRMERRSCHSSLLRSAPVQRKMIVVPEIEQAMLAEARAEVAVADHKASMVLTALGVGFGALLAGVIAGSWRPHELTGIYEVVWWFGAGLAGSSVVAAAAAVWPRWDSSRTTNGVYYWGDVAAHTTFQDLVDSLENDSATMERRTRQQLWALSRIVETKYRWVRRAFVLAAASVPSFLSSALFG